VHPDGPPPPPPPGKKRARETDGLYYRRYEYDVERVINARKERIFNQYPRGAGAAS